MIDVQLKVLFVIPLLLAIMTIVVPISVYADNESSYRWGYNHAFDVYKTANNIDADYPSSNVTSVCEGYQEAQGVVTNQTACSDGYVNGWKAWCGTDSKDCTDLVLNGVFPDKHKVLLSSNSSPPS